MKFYVGEECTIQTYDHRDQSQYIENVKLVMFIPSMKEWIVEYPSTSTKYSVHQDHLSKIHQDHLRKKTTLPKIEKGSRVTVELEVSHVYSNYTGDEQIDLIVPGKDKNQSLVFYSKDVISVKPKPLEVGERVVVLTGCHAGYSGLIIAQYQDYFWVNLDNNNVPQSYIVSNLKREK